MIFVGELDFRAAGCGHGEFGGIVGFGFQAQALGPVRHVHEEVGVLIEVVLFAVSRCDHGFKPVPFGALVETFAFLERAGLVLDVGSQSHLHAEVERVGVFAFAGDLAGDIEAVALRGEGHLESDVAGGGAADGDGFLGIENRCVIGCQGAGIDFLAGGFSVRFGFEDFDLEDDRIALADDLAAFCEGMKHHRTIRQHAELELPLFHDHEVIAPWFFIDGGEFGPDGAERNDGKRRQRQAFHEGGHGAECGRSIC